jgi:hypothetical protein
MAPAVGSGNFGQALLWGLTAFGLAFTVAGGGDALTADAHELQPPRVRALRRSGLIVGLFTVLVTVPLAFVFTTLVPPPDVAAWLDAPLPAIADHLAGPGWATHLLMLSLVAAALLLLVPGAYYALTDAQQLLRRLAEGRALPEGLAAPHPRLGTFARALDVAAVGVVGIVIIAGGGRVSWLSHAYVIAMMATLLVKIAALTRLRATAHEPRPYRAPLNAWFLGRELPLGLLGTGVLVGASGIALLVVGDIPAMAMTVMLVATRVWDMFAAAA